MQEILRKLAHLFFGLGIAALVLAAGRTAAIAVLACMLFCGVTAIDLITRGYRVPIISVLVRYLDRGAGLFISRSAPLPVSLYSRPGFPCRPWWRLPCSIV